MTFESVRRSNLTVIRWGLALCLAVCFGSVRASPQVTWQANAKACTLLTMAEIESAIALKVSAFKEVGSPGKPASGSAGGEVCTAATPTATVMLRFAKKTGSPGREAKGIEMAKQMGAKIEVKTFGPITCSTFVPPSNQASQIGFNTTCSVTKGDAVAAIEVTMKAQKDMVPIDKLRTLAEKMASRF